MIRRLAFVLTALLIAALPAKAESPIPSGLYEVSYTDAELGIVVGYAEVSEDGAIELRLAHPERGTVHRLTATRAERTGARIVIELTGENPIAQRFTISDVAGRGLIFDPATDSGTLTVAGETAASIEIAVAERRHPGEETVRLELEAREDGRYEGSWSMAVDQATGRAANGGGRAGFLEERGEETFQTGSEVWQPALPEIWGAFDMADTADPNSAYSFVTEDMRGSPAAHRTLFIYGPNLPKRWGRIELRVPAAAGLTYHPYALKSELGGEAAPGYAERGFVELWQRRGLEQLRQGLPQEEHRRAGNLDWIMLRVEVAPGTQPGPQEFKLNGVPVRWVLRFGDVEAETEFVRLLAQDAEGDEFEATQEVFRPERLRLRVRTNRHLEAEQFRVAVAHNGEILNFRGDPFLIARRAPDDPQSYLTPPIELQDSERHGATATAINPLLVQAGDRLHAALLHEGLAEGHNRPAVAQVFNSPLRAWPEDVGTSDLGQWPRTGDPWVAAVRRAAGCHEIVSPPEGGRWEDYANDSHEDFWNFVVTPTSWYESGPESAEDEKWVRSISVNLGDHAAMLLLKRRFLESMTKQRDSFDALLEAGEAALPDLLALRKSLIPVAAREYETWRQASSNPTAENEAAFRASRFPMGDYEVPAPGGDSVPFRQFLKYERFDVVASQFGIDRREVPQALAAATRAAIAQYRADLSDALESAEDTGDCDVEELIELTGYGFDAVVGALLPRLMRRPREAMGGPRYWEPQPMARAYVKTLTTLANAVRAQEELAEIDTQMALVAITGAIALPASGVLVAEYAGVQAASAVLNGARTLVAAAFLGVDAADIAYSVYDEVKRQIEARAEVQFARGAAAVLGGARAYDAETQMPSLEQSFATAGLAGLGLYGLKAGWRDVNEGYHGWKNAEQLAAVARGKALAPNLLRDEVSELSTAQRRDLTAYIEDAEAVRRVAGRRALDRRQARTLAHLEELEAARRGGDAGQRPDWARELSEQAYADLTVLTRGAGGEVYLRLDLEQLARGDPARLNEILSGPNRSAALDFLRWNACRDVGYLETAVRRRLQRVQEPVDGVFEAAAGWRQLNDRISEIGWRFEAEASRFDSEVSPFSGKLDEYIYVNVSGSHFAAGAVSDNAGFTRFYYPDSGVLDFYSAFRHETPRWFPAFDDIQLTPRGTPTATHMNLMAMWEVGIGFAGGGQRLSHAKLSGIVNGPSLAHLTWLRGVAGGDLARVPPEALRELYSAQYLESALVQAGYEIVDIRVVGPKTAASAEALYDRVLETFQGGSLTAAERANAAARAEGFLIQHFGGDWRNSIDEIVGSFTLEVDVRPIPGLTARPGRDVSEIKRGSSLDAEFELLGSGEGLPAFESPFAGPSGRGEFDPVGSLSEGQRRGGGDSPFGPGNNDPTKPLSGDGAGGAQPPTKPSPPEDAPGSPSPWQADTRTDPDVANAMPTPVSEDARIEEFLTEMRSRPQYQELVDRVTAAQAAEAGAQRIETGHLRNIARLRADMPPSARELADEAYTAVQRLLDEEIVVLAGGRQMDDAVLLDVARDIHLRAGPGRDVADLVAISLANHGASVAPSSLARATGLTQEEAAAALERAHRALGR